ncbi:MAG: STAS domain-containing protein [Isosphaeraceae bacterium]
MSASTMTPRLELEAVGRVTVVSFLDARIVHDHVIEELGEQLVRLVEHNGLRNILLNFGRVRAFSSAGLGKLLILRKKLLQQRGTLKLCCLNQDLQFLFQLKCGEGKKSLFEVFHEEQKALDSF